MGSEWTTIGDIAQVFDGPHATPNKIDEGPYFLSISSLEAGKLDLQKSARISDEQFEKWTKRVTPEEGDLLFSYETRLGEAALMPGGIKACLGRRMGLLRPSRAKVDPRFLLYAYLGPEFQQEIKTRTNYGATVERIALKELPDFPIQLPPLSEQKAIAHILGTLDDKIELNRRINRSLEEMAQALFKSWFVDFDPVIDNALAAGNPIPDELASRAEVRKNALANGITEQGSGGDSIPSDYKSLFPAAFEFTDELGWIPEGWEARQLGELATVTKGKSYKSSELQSSTTALVTLKSFSRGGGYRLDGLKEYSGTYKPEQVVVPGDLIISYTDVTQAADVIGKPAMVIPDERYEALVISLDVGVVRPHDLSQKHFLYHLARTNSFENWMLSRTSGTTVLHLSKTALPTFETVFPSKALVREFDKIISPLFERTVQNIREARVLEKLRDTLLPILISGELRAPMVEREEKEVMG